MRKAFALSAFLGIAAFSAVAASAEILSPVSVDQVRQFLGSPVTNVTTSNPIDFPAPPQSIADFTKSYTGPISVNGIAQAALRARDESSADYISALYLSKAEHALKRPDPDSWLLQSYAIAVYKSPSHVTDDVWQQWGHDQEARLEGLGWTTSGEKASEGRNGRSVNWRFEKNGGANDPNQEFVLYINIDHMERNPVMVVHRYYFVHHN